jgi:predicted MFS family arabinose efflux permease
MSAAPGGYVALLGLRGVPVLLLSVTAARLVYGALPLVLLLLVSSSRGSYADAGLVIGLYALTAGVLGPARARLVDRIGPARALPALALGLAALIAALVDVVTGPLVAVAVLALLAGSTPPPVGPVMRSAWRRLVDDDADRLRRAYALDAVTEEASFVVGPALAAAAVAWFGPRPVVIACLAALVVTASVLGLKAAPLLSTAAVTGRVVRSWRRSRLIPALVPITAAGLLLGGFDVIAVALALDSSDARAAGLPAAALAAGGLIGGVLYGRRSWPGSLTTQAAVLVTIAVAGVLVTATVAGAFTAVVVVAGAVGLTISPAVVATYLAVDEAVPDGGSEATAWVNAAFNSSLAIGTAGAGVLVDVFSPAAAFLLAAAAALLVVAAGLPLRRSDPERVTAQRGPEN